MIAQVIDTQTLQPSRCARAVDPDLEKIRSNIETNLQLYTASDHTSLTHSLDLGDGFTQVKQLFKAQRKHKGAFGAWLSESYPQISKTTIRLWMRLAKYRDLVQNDNALSIRQADKLVAAYRKAQRPAKHGERDSVETRKLSIGTVTLKGRDLIFHSFDPAVAKQIFNTIVGFREKVGGNH